MQCCPDVIFMLFEITLSPFLSEWHFNTTEKQKYFHWNDYTEKGRVTVCFEKLEFTLLTKGLMFAKKTNFFLVLKVSKVSIWSSLQTQQWGIQRHKKEKSLLMQIGSFPSAFRKTETTNSLPCFVTC